jgi:putative glycerol-1-phosphate prenyltransferase
MLGNKLIYLEAGSGAKHATVKMIKKVKILSSVTSWCGIVDLQRHSRRLQCRTDLVVIGTAFENNTNFLMTDISLFASRA